MIFTRWLRRIIIILLTRVFVLVDRVEYMYRTFYGNIIFTSFVIGRPIFDMVRGIVSISGYKNNGPSVRIELNKK